MFLIPLRVKPELKVGLASQSMVSDAVTAAAAAFPAWRQTPPQKRAQILFRYKQLLQDNAENICQLITAEHGKVIDDAHGELGRGIEVVDYACGISELLKEGEYSKNAGPEIDSWSEFQPLGVVAGVTPFNFPAMVPMWMFPMAIACGNTFILKPSERDPSPACCWENCLLMPVCLMVYSTSSTATAKRFSISLMMCASRR